MSKSERQHELARVWATPTRYDLDFFDKGKEVVVTSASNRDLTEWWMELFQTCLPDSTFAAEKGTMIKLKPAVGVTIKINKVNSALKIYGKNHWPWIMQNFADILEQGNSDVDSLSEGGTENSVTRYLQLDKNFDEVQDLIDMIPEGGGIMNHDFILRIWKALLDDWFGVGASVYIVTPKIDADRLFSVCLLMLRNKGTGLRVTVVTPQKNKEGERFKNTFETTKRLMKKTGSTTPGPKKRLVSDIKMQWVLETIQVRHEEFSTNFVAAFKDEEAEVMCTTAYFHRSHLHFSQKDSVSYSKMPTSELRANYLLPLGIGNISL